MKVFPSPSEMVKLLEPVRIDTKDISCDDFFFSYASPEVRRVRLLVVDLLQQFNKPTLLQAIDALKVEPDIQLALEHCGPNEDSLLLEVEVCIEKAYQTLRSQREDLPTLEETEDETHPLYGYLQEVINIFMRQ